MTKFQLVLLFAGLVTAFALLTVVLSGRKARRVRRVIRHSRVIPWTEFEDSWILQDAKDGAPKGYKYQKIAGCYVIRIYDAEVTNGDFETFDDIYIGQSVNVTNRVHNHFTGKGNGDVYADLKYGRFVYLQIVPCKREELNDLEKALIAEFQATDSYNGTRGGGTDWSERKHGLFHLHRG